MSFLIFNFIPYLPFISARQIKFRVQLSIFSIFIISIGTLFVIEAATITEQDSNYNS